MFLKQHILPTNLDEWRSSSLTMCRIQCTEKSDKQRFAPVSYLSDLQVGFSIQVGGLSVTHGLRLAVEKRHQNIVVLKMINPSINRKSVNDNNRLKNCLFNNNVIIIALLKYEYLPPFT